MARPQGGIYHVKEIRWNAGLSDLKKKKKTLNQRKSVKKIMFLVGDM